MLKCAACGRNVSASDGVKCAKCSCIFEKACVQLPRTAKAPTNWLCPGCVSKQPRKDNTETPAKAGSSTSPTYMSPLELMGGETSANATENILAKELRMVREEMVAMRDEMANFNKRVEAMLTALTDVNERLTGVEHRVATLELDASNRLECLESQVTKITVNESSSNSETLSNLKNTIDTLKIDLNDREQELLMTDIDITGIPETTGESTVHLVQLVSGKLGVQLETRDVVSAQRVGAPRHSASAAASNPSPRPLAVRLARRDLRDSLLREARVRRGANTEGLGLPGQPRRFYINERLTRENRSLFSKAREVGKAKEWKYVWTKGGRIFARRRQDSEVHRLRTLLDVDKVFEIV